ncbi:MAG: hypothetical protein ACR2LV_01570 [Solirubrobacteraceae bacterium]
MNRTLSRETLSPVGAVARGLVAGAAGTAVMTAAQNAYYKATGSESSSTPYEVAKRIVEGVLQREVPAERKEMLNTGMHVFYGTSWGAPYGIMSGSHDSPAPVLSSAIALGVAVWGASLVQLPAMQLAPPVWEYPPKSLATDLGFHLVYGLGTALVFRALR